MERRRFLRGIAVTATAAGLGPSFWRSVYAAPAVEGNAFYGPLSTFVATRPDAAAGVLLPAGFTAREVARQGEPVAGSSYLWHLDPDGGAVFPQADGGWVYTSNEEETPGGAGAIRFDAAGEIVAGYRILDDTKNNCAGGATPWGTWLSCEETVGGMVWECDPTGTAPAVAHPAMGLFSHEAVAVDPIRKQLFLTEDASPCRFYRFTPARWSETGQVGGVPVLAAGLLETMVVDGAPVEGSPDPTGLGGEIDGGLQDLGLPPVLGDEPAPRIRMGETGPWPVRWVPASVITPDRNPASTPFVGGEGCWYDAGSVYFTTKGDNRVWRLDNEAQTLEVIYDPTLVAADGDADGSGPVLSGVDNVTVSPHGQVFVAEDGGNLELVLIAEIDGQRQVAPFLRLVGHDGSEIAGPAFHPDGTRLYFSSQRGTNTTLGGPRGITFEVSGPFGVPLADRTGSGPPEGRPGRPARPGRGPRG